MTGTPVDAADFSGSDGFWWPEPVLLNAGSPPGDGSLPALSFEFLAYSYEEIGGDIFAESIGLVDTDAVDANTSACWLQAKSRLFLDIALRSQLQDFPYDSQDVGILFETQRESSSDLRFRTALPNYATMLPDGDVDGWFVVGAGGVSYEKFMPAVVTAYPRIYLYVRLTRLASIYNLRFVAGTVLLNVLALLGMTLRGEWINDRLNLPLACFLGIVSWQFILVSSTPALGYATRMDNFLIMSLIFNTCIFACSACHIFAWGYCGAAVKARLAAAESDAENGGSEAEPQLEETRTRAGQLEVMDKLPQVGQTACRGPTAWDRFARALSRHEAILRFFLSCAAYAAASYFVLIGGLPKAELPLMRVETCPGGWNTTTQVHCEGGLNSTVLPSMDGFALANSFKSLPDEWLRR